MSKNTSAWQALGIGTKLSLSNFALVSIALALFVTMISYAVSRTIEANAVDEVKARTQLLASLIEATDTDLQRRTQALAAAFKASFQGTIARAPGTIDIQGKPTPTLTLHQKPLNLDFAVADGFTATTGAVATVFARTGDDFIRITTSLKNEQGARAVGTLLDRQHPGYAATLQGRTYTGQATLFGRQYMTQYDPIKDAQGQVIGLTFVGLDFSEHLASLKAAIRSVKIGQTGYFYVLDARPGRHLGELIVHPQREGQSLLADKAPDGREYIKEMLAQKNGLIRYPQLDSAAGDSAPHEKVVAFAEIKHWGWVIAGGMRVDEYTAAIHRLRNIYAVLGALVVLGISGLMYLLARRLITVPLQQVSQAAEAIAQGDLSVDLHTDRQDEIGALITAINHIGSGLSSVVQSVRINANSVASACGDIAQGNQDLSARTETQASALQQTAASMEQLGATVQQNAAHARNANQLAQGASTVALEGGEVVARFVGTMRGINEASQKIADIISVIDGIAFQTNILALNAAVEAARAGEAGRGFAVVAAEVRSLAGRCTDAAKEIKTLINTSVERVEQGGALVDKAGATMTEVVQSVQQVSGVIDAISTASAEQTSGVLQVGEAVTQMDQTTQQNAALVEQMAAATASLKAQAQELVRSVAVFKLARG